MSEMRALLADTAARVMRDAGDVFSARLWQAIEDSGLPAAAISEDQGGAGADLGDAMTILRVAGAHALPAPLAETMLAAWLLSESGLAVPPGPLTVAPVEDAPLPTLARSGDGWRLSGTARFVPWARGAAAIAVLATHDSRMMVARLAPDHGALAREAIPADEPRDDLRFDVTVAPGDLAPAGGGIDLDALLRRGALARAAQMAGALDAVFEMTVRYCGERQQFGRPIGKFQAIQQQVADLAAQVSAASVACDGAIESADSFAVAVAKARVSEAAGHVASIAHQVHGAIGFAREHRLNLYTRRLWSWRDEFGDESQWWAWLGRAAARAGSEGLWPFITNPPR